MQGVKKHMLDEEEKETSKEEKEDSDSSDKDEEKEKSEDDNELIELIEKEDEEKEEGEDKEEEKESEPKIIPPKSKDDKKSEKKEKSKEKDEEKKEEKSEKKEEKKKEPKSEEKKEEKSKSDSEEKKEETKPVKKSKKTPSKSTKEEGSEKSEKKEKKEEPKSEEKKEVKPEDKKEVKTEDKEKESEKKETKSDKKSSKKESAKKEEPKAVVKSKAVTVGEFSAKFKKGKGLAKIIKGVSEIISDTKIGVDDRGLFIIAMDGSHICLVDLLFDYLDMEEFKSPNEALSMGINLVDMAKILERASESDFITLYTIAKINKLYIKMKKDGSSKERIFTTTFVDIEEGEISMDSINAIDYNNIFSIDITTISEAVKDAEIFAEILAIGVEKQLLNFSAEGTTGDLHYSIGKDELKGVEKLGENDKASAFALQFLKSILKIDQIASVFDVKYTPEAPIVFKARLYEDNEKSGSYARYILAPRVEEDTGSMEDD